MTEQELLRDLSRAKIAFRRLASNPFEEMTPEMLEAFRGLLTDLTFWLGNANAYHLEGVYKRWKNGELRKWLATHVNLGSYSLFYGRRLESGEDIEVGQTLNRHGSILQWSTREKTAKWFAGIGGTGAKWAGGALVSAQASGNQVIVDIDRLSAVCGRHRKYLSTFPWRSSLLEMFSGESYEGEVLTTSKVKGTVVDVEWF